MSTEEKVEVIIGVKPSGPVDEKKVIKSQMTPPEGQVEAYHHGGEHHFHPEGFAGGLHSYITVCPYCGATGWSLLPPHGTYFVTCHNCGRAFEVSR